MNPNCPKVSVLCGFSAVFVRFRPCQKLPHGCHFCRFLPHICPTQKAAPLDRSFHRCCFSSAAGQCSGIGMFCSSRGFPYASRHPRPGSRISSAFAWWYYITFNNFINIPPQGRRTAAMLNITTNLPFERSIYDKKSCRQLATNLQLTCNQHQI